MTHGEAVFYHTFLEYGPFAGDIVGRHNGAMISMSTEKAAAAERLDSVLAEGRIEIEDDALAQ